MTRDEYLIRAKEFAHHRNGKLTPEQRQAIRENRRGLTYDQLAAEFGVHRNTIYKTRQFAAI